MSPPQNPRRILAASLLAVLAIAGLLAWQLTPPRDPILGPWTPARLSLFSPNQFYHFHPDGALSTAGDSSGAWERIPGPYYVRPPEAKGIFRIAGRPYYPLGLQYFTAARLGRDNLQRALAERALHATPACARVRIYEARYGEADPSSPSERRTMILVLDGNTLTAYGGWHPQGLEYKRHGTWLTRAWERLRGLLP